MSGEEETPIVLHRTNAHSHHSCHNSREIKCAAAAADTIHDDDIRGKHQEIFVSKRLKAADEEEKAEEERKRRIEAERIGEARQQPKYYMLLEYSPQVTR